MNKWHRLARNENHFPKLPESPDHAKLEEVAQREADVLAAIQQGPGTIRKIAKATGYPSQMVRVALIGLASRQEVATKKGYLGEVLYGTPADMAPPPAVDKYPGTVIDERSHTGAVNTTNHYQLTVRVRLPASPWDGAKHEPQAAKVAQTQEGRSTGEFEGVSYAAGGEA